jgi:hypothetical protein
MKTDKELLQALQPLEEKFKEFEKSDGCQLGAGDVQLLKQLYPDMQQRAMGAMPRVFTSSCSSCVKEVFRVYTSWYLRVKGEL